MENNNKSLPPLKAALEAVQIKHEGTPMILLRDQEGISNKAIAVSLPGFLIATFLDGKNTTQDIQSLFNKNTGNLIKVNEIEALVHQLDQAGLLETDSLKTKREKVLKEFADNPVRKAHHSKEGYPEDPIELATLLGKFFKDPKGPGKEFASKHNGQKSPLALIAPHIDFFRGGPAYAWSYQELSQYAPPDLIVAFGVAHMSPNSPWIMTPKHFVTPYGDMKFSEDLYNEIKNTLWYEPRSDEWVHRTEHSLEFQALWLKYLWRDKAPPWVPILTSSFERFSPDAPPSQVETIERAIKDMAALLKKRIEKGQNIMILAGVDLSHVGPRFGDEEKLGKELEERLEKEDRRSLELVLQVEPESFYKDVVQNKHWRKWCGLSALYTSLRLLKILYGDKPKPGRLLTYDKAADPMGGIVSFASAVFPQ